MLEANSVDSEDESSPPLAARQPTASSGLLPLSASTLSQELVRTTSETLQLGSTLRNRVLAHLHQSSSVEAVDEVAPLIDMVLRVDRQVDRFLNVIMRFEELQAKKRESNSDDDGAFYFLSDPDADDAPPGPHQPR